MKIAGFLLFVLLVTFVPSVNAQCFENSELGRILAGPCTERVIRQGYAPVDQVVGALGPGYGIGGGRIATVIGLAATGAGIGYSIGGRNGAIVGGSAGLVGGILATRNTSAYGQQRQVDCSKRKLNKKEQSICSAALAERQAEAQAVQAAEQVARSTRWLFNRSGQQAVIADGGFPLCNSGRCFMRPGENWQVDRPASGQWAVVLEVPKGAGLVQLPGEVRSVGSQGWEIIAPKEVN